METEAGAADRRGRMIGQAPLTALRGNVAFLRRHGATPELIEELEDLESIHARVESRTAKVDHWKNSEQKQRWLATALLDLEPRLRRIRNYHALPLLREAITRQIQSAKKSAA